MEKRKLGQSGLEIFPLVLGGNVFGWTVDEAASFKILDAYVAAGFNMIDTADVYSIWVPGHKGGESETILGKWLQRDANRSKVLIATKVGFPMGPDSKGLSKAYILRAVEDSLRRLRTDYIDLYQAHTDDPDTAQEETMEAFAQLIEKGKVRAAGASNYGAERLERALEIGVKKGHPVYRTMQPMYNLYDRADYEKNLEELCRASGLGVIPYYSLASGFLTGKYRSEGDLSKSPRGVRVKNYLTERGFRILRALDEVAARLESTPARVSLAWLAARPGITAPIASATNPAQLNDLIEGVRLELDRDSIEVLDRASAY
jgi:aryl-alcohol dehydrogenase-like predicted oxidoreductase